MTTKSALRLQQIWWRGIGLFSYLLGAIGGLLLARLMLQVLAARPDNCAVALLLAITAPLVAPLRSLDAGQPRFGAILELSTLTLLVLLLLLLLLLRAASWWATRQATAGGTP